MWAIACNDSIVLLKTNCGNFIAIFDTRSRAREILKILKENSSNELSNKSYKIFKVDVMKAEE